MMIMQALAEAHSTQCMQFDKCAFCVQSESLFKQIVKTFVDQWRALRMLKLQDITERPDLWAHSDFKSARDTALRNLRSRLATR